MIAGCIDRMRAQACASCANRDNCRIVFPEALGFLLSKNRRDSAAATGTPPFLAFLGEVTKGLERMKPVPQSDFLRSVERQLEAMLAAGPARIDELASALGYSRQTLYRRLKAENVTFEQLLDALRHRLALRLIRDQGLSVKEAAYRLGFSDPAAFSRAFKRWTGSSPRDLRGRKPH